MVVDAVEGIRLFRTCKLQETVAEAFAGRQGGGDMHGMAHKALGCGLLG